MPIDGCPAPQSRLSTLSSWPCGVRSKLAVRHPGSPGETQRLVRASAYCQLIIKPFPSLPPHSSFSRVHAEKSTELHASDVTPLHLFLGNHPARCSLLCLMSCSVPYHTADHLRLALPVLPGPCAVLHYISWSALPAALRRAEPQSQETRKPYVRIIKPPASPLMPSPGVGEQATGDRTW